MAVNKDQFCSIVMISKTNAAKVKVDLISKNFTKDEIIDQLEYLIEEIYNDNYTTE